MKFETVDDYMSSLPADARHALEQVRRVIHEAVPDAEETISYNIPAITCDGERIVHFAGWKKHISLYPVPDGDEAFRERIAPYIASKGTLRFPLQQPIPLELIASIMGRLMSES